MVNISTLLVLVLSVLFFLFALAIAKAISNVVKRMQKTSKALAISEEKNRLLAHRDMLTGLPNRNALDIKINETISNNDNGKFALFFIDLDRFKDVNDTRGHAQGDKLLITIAERLSKVMRENDTVFRFGGDEFVAIINPSNELDQVHNLASKMIKVIAEPQNLYYWKSHMSM